MRKRILNEDSFSDLHYIMFILSCINNQIIVIYLVSTNIFE